MDKKAHPMRVLFYQSIGFLVIIGVCLLDELVGLTALIFRNQGYILNFRESTLKMLIILTVWLVVAGSTRRVLARMRYLESFMKVCAWCRRIEHKGRWMRLEEFLKNGFDTPTSHGICQECLEKEKRALERARQASLQVSAGNSGAA